MAKSIEVATSDRGQGFQGQGYYDNPASIHLMHNPQQIISGHVGVILMTSEVGAIEEFSFYGFLGFLFNVIPPCTLVAINDVTPLKST